MGRALFAAGLSLVMAGLGHFFLGLQRGIWFAVPSSVLLYLYWTDAFEYADVFFLSLGIFAAFDAFSFARRGHGII
ncbi:MAG TPA: hypothetical protein VGQ07_05470 [Nitrospirales bacterium]|jgi:hypothetical protein|nr:hypothetical protein [Nitrospirales bacterium]